MKNVALLLCALVVSCFCVSANAGGLTFTPQLYDNVGFNVDITYGPNGGLAGATNQNTSSSPQLDTSGSFSNLTPVYCTDIWHENYLGSPYQVNSSALLPPSGVGDAPAGFTAISVTDASNRIGWLLSQSSNPSDFSAAAVDQRGAIQLAIWYTVDAYYNHSTLASSFSYTGGSAGMASDYASLVSFAGYNPNAGYDASFYAAGHNGNLYQDLVTTGSVPEPNSMVLGSIGLTFLALWSRWRKRVG